MRTLDSSTSSSSSIARLSLLFAGALSALAACEKGTDSPLPPADLAMSGMEMPAPPDLKTTDLAKSDLASPPDMAVPFTPIPGGLLGMNVPVNLSCDYEKRIWVRDAMGVCQRMIMMNKSTPMKTIRIDMLAAGRYKITAGKRDAFAMDYTVETSESSPAGVYTDGGDPAMATKLTHIYMLEPRSLQVETDLLHDNDTPLPPLGTMCMDYYFERTKCTGSLTW